MKKINIADLLKDCPSGMELDCAIYEDVYFDGIDEVCDIIKCYIQEPKHKIGISFNKYGHYSNTNKSKCVIFPKGKTTWEGFQRPFKDGDVLVHTQNERFVMSIYKSNESGIIINTHAIFWDREEGLSVGMQICCYTDSTRLATEEEKQKLFDAIKSNGYEWNEETKTLKKLEDIEDKGNISDGYHTFNELYEYRLLYNAGMFNEFAKQGLYDVHKSKKHSDGTIPFGDENWFIVQAELPTGQISNHYEIKDWELFNVPEKEKANPYDGHTPQDVAKRLRDFLSLKKLIEPKFKVGDKIVRKDGICVPILITGVGDAYYWFTTENSTEVLPIADQDDWELVPTKFDINTLKPLDKVLMRSSNAREWTVTLYSHYNNNKFYGCGMCCDQCIPYEHNEHLRGTTNDCNEYYKTWE